MEVTKCKRCTKCFFGDKYRFVDVNNKEGK